MTGPGGAQRPVPPTLTEVARELYEARKALGTRLTALALEVEPSIHADIWGAFMALERAIAAALEAAQVDLRAQSGVAPDRDGRDPTVAERWPQEAAVAGAIYEAARSMARRGLFPRDDWGQASIIAVTEFTTAVVKALAQDSAAPRSSPEGPTPAAQEGEPR